MEDLKKKTSETFQTSTQHQSGTTGPAAAPKMARRRVQQVAKILSMDGLITATTTTSTTCNNNNNNNGGQTDVDDNDNVDDSTSTSMSDDDDDDDAIHVTALQSLKQGTKIMECTATTIALDPLYRKTHCGFCATSSSSSSSSSYHPPFVLRQCEKCYQISFCPNCDQYYKEQYHDTIECTALQELTRVMSGGRGNDDDDDVSMVDSTHLLALRILLMSYSNLKNNNNSNKDSEKDESLLLDTLYEGNLVQDDDDEVKTFAKHLVTHLHNHVPHSSKWLPTEDIFLRVLSQVIGCSHAITDISLPLGKQCLGRALFPYHSFYNHSCHPNAFLSCELASSNISTSDNKQQQQQETFGNGPGAGIIHNNNNNNKTKNIHASSSWIESSSSSSSTSVRATVHLLEDVNRGDPITLSYIPLCGLAVSERKKHLLHGYMFECHCDACRTPTIVLPSDADVHSLREIQYSCNERLLMVQTQRMKPSLKHLQEQDNDNHDDDDDEEEIEHVLSLVTMTQRGIKNQNIPVTHEVSLETHRLLAMGHSLLGQHKEAIVHHQSFVEIVKQIPGLFDPVALATQYWEYSKDLLRSNPIGHKKEEEEDVDENNGGDEIGDKKEEENGADENNDGDENDDDTVKETSNIKQCIQYQHLAVQDLTKAVGGDHPWVQWMSSNLLCMDTGGSTKDEDYSHDLQQTIDANKKRKRSSS